MGQWKSTSTTSSASRLIATVLAVLGIAGCAGQIRPDAVIPAIEANYPSAEFTACGQRWLGLGYCQVASGVDLDTVELAIQGYYQGTVRFATTCRSDSDPSDPVSYSKSDVIPYFISGPAQKSCGISFIVSPAYPNQEKDPIIVRAFEGHLWIKVMNPGDQAVGFVSKFPANPNPSVSVSIPVGNIPSVQVAFKSDLCGINFQPAAGVAVDNGVVHIQFKDLQPKPPIQTCVVEGVVFAQSGPVRVSWFVSAHDPGFVPLPVPALVQDSSHLSVSADANTSVIALDDSYVIDRETKFSFDATKPHVLRLLTVSGRSLIGEFTPGKGWKWTL